jgi:hypothetical protein
VHFQFLPVKPHKLLNYQRLASLKYFLFQILADSLGIPKLLDFGRLLGRLRCFGGLLGGLFCSHSGGCSPSGQAKRIPRPQALPYPYT